MKRVQARSLARNVRRGFSSALVALAALALAAYGAPPARAQSAAPMTVSQYDTAIAKVAADSNAAADGQDGAASKAMTDIQAVLRPNVIASPRLIFVDNRLILAQMQAAELVKDGDDRTTRWEKIADELDQIRASLPKQGTADASAPPKDPNLSAAAVLSQREFASDPIPPKSMWDRLGDWLENLLNKIHRPHASRGPSVPDHISPLLPEAILVVIIVVAIGLIAYVVAQWLRNRGPGSGRGKRAGDSGLALTFEEKELVATHNYTRLRELADEAAQRGDFRSAFRLTFLATLVFLDSEGAIKLDRSKTNWEYLRSVASRSDLRGELQPIVRDFDRIWYGEQPAAASDYERAGQGYNSVQQLVASWNQAALLPGAAGGGSSESATSTSPRRPAGVS